MLVRDFTCAVCGAPRKTVENAIVVICLHCGAIVTFGSDATPLAERHAAGIQQLVKPSAAQARLSAIAMEMHTPATLHDRERWRLLAEEQLLVMGILGLGLKLPALPEARAKHIEDAIAMQEIATFDPKIAGLMGGFARAAMTMTTGDPVAAARTMLAAAKTYYGAIAAHPDCPPGAMREGSDHLAKELVRSSIGGYASLLGNRAIERIRTEVLGDETQRGPTPRCPKCGGPLASAGLTRCPHCGAVTSVDTDDSWTAAQLGLWEISKADLVRRGQLDGPHPVIHAVGGFIHTNARDVPPEKAAAFLRRAIPWLSLAELDHGLGILAQAVSSPDQHALLDGIRAHTRDWVPDVSQRPATPAAPTHFPPPTPAEEGAWIESALALWSYRRGDNLIELLGHPLSAMQVAAVHEQPTGVSARAALAFFERAVPGFSRPMMQNEVLRLTPGHDHPRVRAFLTDLAALLC